MPAATPTPRHEPAPVPILEASDLIVSYGARHVLDGLSLSFAPGEFTAIIGPNGSGKSTLLRALARLLRPQQGRVSFDGQDIHETSPREFARRLAFLPQAPEGPSDLTVEELVWRGRYPHRGLFAAARPEDRAAVEWALQRARVDDLRQRALATLSGGERQRAWIAMSLSREPDLLLLDEPTTFLDIGHQAELLGLLGSLNRQRGLTVIMVLHDVTQAAQYAKRIIALRDGQILHDGPPVQVVTADHVSDLFGAAVNVFADPATGSPVVVPTVPLVSADEIEGS
ncbi:MAG: ABC transporter ATP-binding protein [Dehalococcoidia bacterium]|jgi:ABC-type cobalamin/Fe3+-siderophores transport system ATPase subunit|nr:ABC transporter ATP-binding protein [Dehalococcoidia bacterium]